MTDAHAFAADVMRRYRVRPEAAERILAHCDVTVLNPDSVQGGGMVQYTTRPDYWHVVLHTRQDEACLHEMAHVWWFLHQTDAMVAMLIDQYHVQGDLRHMPRFRRVRQACYEGIHGNGQGFDGYWVGPPYNRWNADEMFAGMASLIMGDVEMLPHAMRGLFEGLFLPRQTIWFPMVWA